MVMTEIEIFEHVYYHLDVARNAVILSGCIIFRTSIC